MDSFRSPHKNSRIVPKGSGLVAQAAPSVQQIFLSRKWDERKRCCALTGTTISKNLLSASCIYPFLLSADPATTIRGRCATALTRSNTIDPIVEISVRLCSAREVHVEDDKAKSCGVFTRAS
jgi:hypothetical protein